MTISNRELITNKQQTNAAFIGLCAPAMGAGKTTLADYLVQEHGFVIVRFAAGLKAMTEALFRTMGLPPADAEALISDPSLKNAPVPALGGVTPRYLMQTLGTEWGRELHGDGFWVDMTMAKVNSLLAEGRSVVIDDARFTNEADAVSAAGGRMVRIVRPGLTVEGPRHASEGELDEYPCFATLINDCRPEKMFRQADKLVSSFRLLNAA